MLAMYSGEMNSVPLQYTVASIWPLPCGLLLQCAEDSSPHVSSEAKHAMVSPLPVHDWSCDGLRESAFLGSGGFISPGLHNSFAGSISRRSSLPSPLPPAPVSALFTLQHPLEEPQVKSYQSADI